jgi:hypothetical protein
MIDKLLLQKLSMAKEKMQLNEKEKILSWNDFFNKILEKSECVDEANEFISDIYENGYESCDFKTLTEIINGRKLGR